jgi:aspartate/glutamate racemase
MTAAQSAQVSLRHRVPVRRFEQYEAAVQALTPYEAAMCEKASWLRSKGLTVTDQDQPEEAFCLYPTRPLQPPLAIVGGMGPMAGAMAFRRACTRFRNSRVVVLYQACSIPDRSRVILREGALDAPLCRDVGLRLAAAVRLAVGLAGESVQPVRCILACNSAHYFWTLLRDDLRSDAPGKTCDVEMVSLAESLLEELKRRSCRGALLLATEGARVGRVLSTPLREAGIGFEEPSPTLERLLMRTIFEGMKAFDERRAVELGNAFFEAILTTARDCDCIVAGCTEIPLTVELLRLHGSPNVADFLSRVKIVDPLEEALSRA